jgi:hypothetical protein
LEEMTDKVFVRCGLSSGRLFCSTSIASLVQVRAMSSRRSRTRMLDAMAICRHSAARSLHTSEVSMAVTPAAVLPGTPTSLGSAGFPTIEEALPDGPQLRPTGLGSGIDKDRQDYTGPEGGTCVLCGFDCSDARSAAACAHSYANLRSCSRCLRLSVRPAA